jgi:hypothetical protein
LGLDAAGPRPHPQDAVRAGRRDQRAGGVESDRDHLARVLALQDHLAGAQVTDLQVAVGAGRGQQAVVGGEGHRPHRATEQVVQEVLDRLAGPHVPDADHAVGLADRQQRAVGVEGQAHAAVFVGGDGQYQHAFTEPP